MKLTDCPNEAQLRDILHAAFHDIELRDLADIIHILDCALPYNPPLQAPDAPCLNARNLLLNAALSPAPRRTITPPQPPTPA
jgi:hypothetical protein